MQLVYQNCDMAPGYMCAYTTHLNMARNNLDASAMTVLSNSSWCNRLRTLVLDGNHLGEAGVLALVLQIWVSGKP